MMHLLAALIFAVLETQNFSTYVLFIATWSCCQSDSCKQGNYLGT